MRGPIVSSRSVRDKTDTVGCKRAESLRRKDRTAQRDSSHIDNTNDDKDTAADAEYPHSPLDGTCRRKTAAHSGCFIQHVTQPRHRQRASSSEQRTACAILLSLKYLVPTCLRPAEGLFAWYRALSVLRGESSAHAPVTTALRAALYGSKYDISVNLTSSF
jgi:hypothetical protein